VENTINGTTSERTFKIPALASLGELRDSQIVLVTDSREQLPLKFEHFKTVVKCLPTADYSIVGFESEVGFERKSLDDLVQCTCGESRVRFEKELLRLRSFDLCRLLIIGSEQAILDHAYRSNVAPSSVIGSICAWQIRYRVPVLWAADAKQAALQIERLSFYYVREAVKRANNVVRAQALVDQ
jgi:DNA excision repair protein ERCC-4